MNRKFVDKANRYYITATAVLSWHKGNSKPYFSLTADGKDRGCEFGGCCHDDILKHWPDLQPLADLHLSDIDGVPMYAEANGWYWLAGALGGAGERYHGSNDGKTPDECLKIFAEHCRIPLEEAESIRLWAMIQGGRTRFAQWIEEQKPRWLTEANAAIELFGLERPTVAS